MREYNISTGATISGTTTLVFLRASAAPSTNLEFLRWWAGFYTNATSAQQRVQLALSSGSPTGTAVTPTKLKEADAASNITGSTTPAGGNAAMNVSTEITNRTVVHEDAFNVLNGWLYVPTPAETRVQPAGAASGMTMYFPVAPSGLGWAFGVQYREV